MQISETHTYATLAMVKETLDLFEVVKWPLYREVSPTILMKEYIFIHGTYILNPIVL